MSRSCELRAERTPSLTVISVGPGLISLAWPILCSGVAEVLDTSVNVMWVGRELGDVSLAALSNANLLWGALFVAASGMSIAGTVWVGRSLGEGDIKAAKVAVGTIVSASAVVSVICLLPIMVWAHFLLGALGTPVTAWLQATEYLRILLLAVPAIYLNAAVMAILQAAGDSKTGFYLAAVSVAIDAALNPVLIIGVPPFPPLGIAGSALATLTSQTTLLIALLVRVYRSGHPLCLRRGQFSLLRIHWARAAPLLRESGSMAVQVLWASVEQMLMISLVNRFGADVTAGYGVMVQLWNLMMMPAAAIGAAITAMAAQNIGAGRWDRVRSVTWFGLAYGALVTAGLVVVVEMLGACICGVFLPAGSPSLSIALQINRDATWSLVLLGGYLVWVGVMRATGPVWVPLAISAGVLAVRFPVTAALLGRWQAQAIWWSFPSSAAVTSILAVLVAHFCRRTRPVLPKAG